MSRNQIVGKLDRFLRGSALDPEARAVYLFVEIRKILDHAYDKKGDYTLLRFYCDWIVHTEKSRNLEHIAPLVEKAYAGVKAEMERGPYPPPDRSPVGEFIYMDALQKEMMSLFGKEGLPGDLFDKQRWAGFVAATVQVLIDQPILEAIPEVPRLVLIPSNPRCICGIMEFAQPITAYDGKKYSSYDFGNAY